MGLAEKLKNKYWAIILSIILLIVVNYFKPELWYLVSSILLAYLITDIVKIFFIKGGEGIFQIPIVNTQTRSTGHAYLWFILFIILSALIAQYIGIPLYSNFFKDLIGWKYYLIPNAILAFLVYLDLHITFYKRN